MKTPGDGRRGEKAVLWDFHGTLVREPGGWTGAAVAVLDRFEPDRRIGPELIAPNLLDGFPWHRPDEPHPETGDADAWWLNVEPIFARAFAAAGIPVARAKELATHVRGTYLEPHRFEAFAETHQALAELSAAGWRHVILSNHVPELPQIVDLLGLGELVDAVVCSALIGYEKPHPRAYAEGRLAAGSPSRIWMVGDNPEVDVLGAERCGIPAILVRRHDPRCARRAEDLRQAAAMILESDGEAIHAE